MADLTIQRNAGFKFRIRVLNGGDVPNDITDWTFAGAFAGSEGELIAMTTAVDSSGYVTFSVSKANAALLTEDYYPFDCLFKVSGLGDPLLLKKGIARVIDGVTSWT